MTTCVKVFEVGGIIHYLINRMCVIRSISDLKLDYENNPAIKYYIIDSFAHTWN